MFDVFKNSVGRNEQLAHEVLSKNIPFYNQLSEIAKEKFRFRVLKFILSKRFYGAQGFVITFEHKISIAAAAIQITFGLSEYSYGQFHTIVLHEDVYRSPSTGALHRGETDPSNGLIVLSWKYFVEGFSSNADRMNLGLHEMAHAFFASLLDFTSESDSVVEYLNTFIFNSEEEIVKLRTGRKHLFREYASENIYEFFAVAVEYFFEDPEDFAREMPEIYKYLCLTLHQDPVKKSWGTFNYQDYFKVNQISYHTEVKEDTISFEVKSDPFQLNGSSNARFIPLYFMLIVFALLGFSNGNIFGGIIPIFIGIIPIVLLISRLKKKYLFGMDNFFIHYKPFQSDIYIKGIPYSNILSFDFSDSVIVHFMEDGYLKSEKIVVQDQLLLDDIKSFMLSKKVMIKSFGRRIPRISPFRRR